MQTSMPVSHSSDQNTFKQIRKFKFGLFALCALLLSACANQPRVIVDYDSQVNFKTMTQYDWMTDSQKQTLSSSVTDAKSSNNRIETQIINLSDKQLLSKRINRSIEAALAAKNMTRNNNQPQMLIAYELVQRTSVIRDHYYDSPFGVYIGGCSSGGHFCTGTQLHGQSRDYLLTELFLTLRMVNAQTLDVLWEGMTEMPKMTSKKSVENYEQEISAAVNRLIERFPPPLVTKS